MKKITLLTSILYISASVFLFSQESKEDKAYKEKFIEHINLTNIKGSFINSTIGVLEQNIDNPQIQEDQKKLIKEFIDRIKGISQDDLLGIFIAPYKKNFSLKELSKLNKFYASPIGKKISQTQIEISKEVKTNAENYGKSIAEELVKKYQEEAAKKADELKKQEEIKKAAEETKKQEETKKTENPTEVKKTKIEPKTKKAEEIIKPKIQTKKK